MEFPPAPQNASTIRSQRHLSAMCRAMRSGVTENHESRDKNCICKIYAGYPFQSETSSTVIQSNALVKF